MCEVNFFASRGALAEMEVAVGGAGGGCPDVAALWKQEEGCTLERTMAKGPAVSPTSVLHFFLRLSGIRATALKHPGDDAVADSWESSGHFT